MNPTLRVAGCDLGKASAKFVVGAPCADGTLDVEKLDTVVHAGQPAAAFREWYRRAGVERCAALGTTGVHSEEIIAPAVTALPEDACLETALNATYGAGGALNVISVGARGYAVFVRRADGEVQYLENEKCSSGTGETMIKIAGRFGLTIEAADRLACSATGALPITARCSVFAKSEMTHFGNQGKPVDTLFRGYFDSVAAYVTALLARLRVDGPVLVIGGGSRIRALVAALERRLGAAVTVPEEPLHLEAIGAALLAATQQRAGVATDLPADPGELIRPRQRRFRTLAPASRWAHRVRRLTAPAVRPGAERQPSILGLDLGSTGSKAVLTSIATGEPVLDVYDRTRGNPVDAAQRLLRAILTRTEPDVRAIGLTGSGREAAATVMRAAYPQLASRILVLNEIVAHATAAIRCDEMGGKSLSVVEIGGQDAKFIQIVGGQIVESDMNKACSAGTGSFLEEQGVFFGIEEIEEFARLAQHATAPPDLGQMCTVFVAEAAAEASNEGFQTADLLAGFQYSVIHNYINRVMGQRTFRERIFFQGKPASGPSLAWTLAAVTGREVIVPPNPGAMGAWGISLRALAAFGAESLTAAAPFDLRTALEARVVARTDFQCRDPRCETFCSIEKTAVEVHGTRATVHAGGACPKYEISTAARPKLPVEAPSAFDERRAVLAPYLADRNGQRVVAVPLAATCHGYLPWLVTFVHELGFGVQVLRPDAHSLRRGEERCHAYDACAPAKIAHGVVDAGAETIFFPKILGLGDRDGSCGKTCPMEQALPDMVRQALRARGRTVDIVHPRLAFDSGLRSIPFQRQAYAAAKSLGGSILRARRAIRRAAGAQLRYENQMAAIGRRTLDYARTAGMPVVAVCGALHVIHDRTVSAEIPRLLRDNGVLALPMDCFPVPRATPSLPRIFWAEANRALRTSLAARARGDTYPLLLSSFGCGPASFVEQIFTTLMESYPHTALETDAHGGTAGYVTRIQAFLHTVRQHDRRPAPVTGARLRLLEELPADSESEAKTARVVVPALADRLAGIRAAAYRALGFDAVAAGSPDADQLTAGRRDCSGKECLPYQILWASFRQQIGRSTPDKRIVLLQASGEGMCRFCLFSIKDQISIAHWGLEHRVAVQHSLPLGKGESAFLESFFGGTLAWDILNQLAAYCGPLETISGEANRLYHSFCDEVEELLLRQWGNGEGRAVRPGLVDLIARAARAFAALAARAPAAPERRTVFLSGDFYTRLEPRANDSLIRRLNERGLQVVVEPFAAVMEYVAAERLSDLFEFPVGRLKNAFVRATMRRMTREFYGTVRALHPWLPVTDVPATLRQARQFLDRYPQGEAPMIVGSVLHHWHQRICDGVVTVSPWGCGPAHVSESLLRHQRDIPILFLYVDGSPIDERRLNAFAFRLRSKPPRTPTWSPQPLPQALQAAAVAGRDTRA